jgi:hypothetical protein
MLTLVVPVMETASSTTAVPEAAIVTTSTPACCTATLVPTLTAAVATVTVAEPVVAVIAKLFSSVVTPFTLTASRNTVPPVPPVRSMRVPAVTVRTSSVMAVPALSICNTVGAGDGGVDTP